MGFVPLTFPSLTFGLTFKLRNHTQFRANLGGAGHYHNEPNIRPVRLTHIFHFLDILTRCHLRCILRSKAAIALQHGVIGAADFEKNGPSALLLSVRDA